MKCQCREQTRDKGFEGGDDRNEAALLYCFLGRALTGRLSLHSTAQRHCHTLQVSPGRNLWMRKRANAGPDDWDWEIPQALLDVSLGAMQYQALSASPFPLKLYAGLGFVLWSVMDFIYDMLG